jgi:hypothetical protein
MVITEMDRADFMYQYGFDLVEAKHFDVSLGKMAKVAPEGKVSYRLGGGSMIVTVDKVEVSKDDRRKMFNEEIGRLVKEKEHLTNPAWVEHLDVLIDRLKVSLLMLDEG